MTRFLALTAASLLAAAPAFAQEDAGRESKYKERTEIDFTTPSLPPTSTQSPSLIGRSIRRMMPLTKLLTMF